MRSIKLMAICLAFFSTIVCIATVWGEAESEQANELELDPVTVTAARTERELSKVPASVSTISKARIEESYAETVPELLQDTAGVFMYDSSGVGTAERINMRGLWGGMSTHQLVLIDGIPQNRTETKLVDWNLIPLENIERIEVLRGPASALYGDNAMSGVINIITKRPNEKPTTKLSGSYGNYSTRNYKMFTSGTTDKLGYQFSASQRLTDGYREHADYDGIHLSGNLDYRLNDSQHLRLLLGYHEIDRGAHPWALSEDQIAEDRRQARPGTENDKSKDENLDMGLIHNWDIGPGAEIEETAYYRHGDRDTFYTSRDTKEQVEQEDAYGLLWKVDTSLKLLGLKHFLTAGIDLERNEFDYQEYAAPDNIRGELGGDYDVSRDKIGPYLQDAIQLSNPLRLVLGVRYDLIEFDFNNRMDAAKSANESMSATSPSAGMVYTYGENSNLYANYAQAFRSPTIGQMFTYGSANSDLAPEEADNYEVGVRHRFNDWIRTDASFYWMEIDNEIRYDFANRQYLNRGQTSHQGVEASLRFKIMEGWTGFANYTYTRAKNKSGENDGNYLTNIPIHKGSVGTRYETVTGLGVNLAATRVGKSYIDDENTEKLSAYTTIDTKVDYEYGFMNLFLAVDNIFDYEYESHGYTMMGTKFLSPHPGRTYAVGAEVAF